MMPYKFKPKSIKCELYGKIAWSICLVWLGFLCGRLYGIHAYENLQLEEIRRLTAQIEYKGGEE